MGCDVSSLRPTKGAGANKKNKKKTADAATKNGEHLGKEFEGSSSLEIPVPESKRVEHEHEKKRSKGSKKVSHSQPRSATPGRGQAESKLNPSCLIELQTIINEMSDSSSRGTSLSTPQLFRITPTIRDEVEPGTWAWWRQELRCEQVTRDGYSCVQLQDVANRLTCQHADNPESVDLDLSNCYMERTAPYVLGRFFASTQLKELRWITSLRLDGNYFTDDGFGTMLATMSAENEEQTILPLLRQLYVNNMNLDCSSVTGLLAYLFPVNRRAMHSLPSDSTLCIAGGRADRPSEAFIAGNKHGPRVPLFPSLSVLSLSDNPGLGTDGLIQILRNFLAVHYEPSSISVVDLSRCGFDKASAGSFQEYFGQLSKATEMGCYPVVPARFVLSGNQHGISDLHVIHSQASTSVQLVL
ncbi:hypothetical protein ABL78_5434 [Leptomonas seymouri]|uniref:Leucine-rich domain-containing protein n=1 Tax=Leptomonas seymouri TaxID=5684 RepID=A0A0N1I4U2_LEPSE|nr:hypothetical protein ABL78_5434 [Leptomonas seymouri]|eukprot:KPI85514.1 hypothetical protein ABL78_5434 [Leptomonas seymouri]